MHHDDLEVLLRAALRQTSPSGYEDLVQSVMANYGFGGKVSEVEVEHVSDPSQPLTIQFHYHRDHGDDWGQDRITAIFGPTLVPMVDKLDLPRYPLDLGSLRTDSSTVEMKLPQGWNSELPEAGAGDPKMQERVEGAKWSGRFPPGEDSRLAEMTFLNCHDGACELVIQP